MKSSFFVCFRDQTANSNDCAYINPNFEMKSLEYKFKSIFNK